MKNYTPGLLLIVLFLSFISADVAMAVDEDGCLICHKFPGMVRIEKGENRLRVLHVDEDLYLSSPHGKYSCRKCHAEITKVPHTGQTGVDCSSNCHLDDKDNRLIAEFPLESFHNKEQSYIIGLEDESACTTCHSNYPHHEDKIIRVLLNMHTGFMKCIVCHVNRDRYSNIQFEWRNAEKVKFYGKNFGSYFNPNTGKANESGDYISRIGAVMINGSKKEILTHSGDIGRARKFLSNTGISNKDKKNELEYFHRDIEKKEVSMACEECHSSESILDFSMLGFDGKKKKNLIDINIKGLVVKYKEFYLPRLFGD